MTFYAVFCTDTLMTRDESDLYLFTQDGYMNNGGRQSRNIMNCFTSTLLPCVRCSKLANSPPINVLVSRGPRRQSSLEKQPQMIF